MGEKPPPYNRYLSRYFSWSIQTVAARNRMDLSDRVEGNFSPLPHHRTCRSAYGGSVLYLVLLQRFCSLLSNLRLPAFCLIYVSATLRISSEQNIFYMRFWTVQPFPNLHLVLWLLLTSHSSLLLQISLSVRPHGINQYSFLVYLLGLRSRVTVTFWTSLLCANLSAYYAFVPSFCPSGYDFAIPSSRLCLTT